MASALVSPNSSEGHEGHARKPSQQANGHEITDFDEKLIVDVSVDGGNTLTVPEGEDDRPSTPMMHEGDGKPNLMSLTEGNADQHYHQHQEKIQKAADQIHQFRSSLDPFFKQHASVLYVKKAIAEDAFVYRFLVARQMHLNKATEMFRQAVEYREKHKLDTILHHPCPKASAFLRVGYQGWHGHDRHGRPIFIERTGSQNMKEVWKVGNLEERIAYHHFVTEYFIQRVCDDASKRSGRPIDQVVFIIDMKGFGTQHMLKVQYQYVNAIAKINSLILPEYLGSVFIINAPRIFAMVWKVVRGFLDQRTREKINIYSDGGKATIEKMISLDELPEIVGGTRKSHESGFLESSPPVISFHQLIASLNASAPASNASSSSSKPKTSKSSTTS